MAYFVFDLDETLGNFHTPYYFLVDLRSAADQTAYQNFVAAVATIEDSGNPLGIIRPGILTVMRKLKQLKDSGIVKSLVIYSNNSHLESLEFARDVIQHVVEDSTLFSDCIHWGREGREIEHTIPTREGSANKTWAVLTNLMIHGPTAADASTLTPDKLYFFDDQEHMLEKKLPEGHTVRMMEYPFKASSTRVGHIYKDAVMEAFKDNEAGLSDFVDNFKTNDSAKYTFLTPKKAFESHTQFLVARTRGTVNRTTPVPDPDQSIAKCMELLRKFAAPPPQPPQEGGKRVNHRRTRRRGKKRHGSRRR
jgi:hypothetical protein